MLAKKFEIPRKMGDKSIILDKVMRWVFKGSLSKPGRTYGTRIGMIINAAKETKTIPIKNTEKPLSMNLLPVCSPSFSLSIKKGTKTKTDTIEATKKKKRSGILKAAKYRSSPRLAPKVAAKS